MGDGMAPEIGYQDAAVRARLHATGQAARTLALIE
jgi:hypothetical protein